MATVNIYSLEWVRGTDPPLKAVIAYDIDGVRQYSTLEYAATPARYAELWPPVEADRLAVQAAAEASYSVMNEDGTTTTWP